MRYCTCSRWEMWSFMWPCDKNLYKSIDILWRFVDLSWISLMFVQPVIYYHFRRTRMATLWEYSKPVSYRTLWFYRSTLYYIKHLKWNYLTSEIDRPTCFSLSSLWSSLYSYDFTSLLKQNEAAEISFRSALRPRNKIFITGQLK